MVNGYSSIKEGFASTPRVESVDNTDKITDLTDDIKELEKELKMKKDALVKEVKKSVEMDMEDGEMKRNDMERNMDKESGEMDMEDGEMKRNDMERNMNKESDEVNIEDDMTNKSNMDNEGDDIEGFKSVIEEPFRGSSIIVRKYLSDLLKAVLLALLFYLVSSKDMIMFTKPIYDLVKNVMSVEVLHTLIFLLLSYVVISLTF